MLEWNVTASVIYCMFYKSMYVFKFNAFYITLWGLDFPYLLAVMSHHPLVEGWWCDMLRSLIEEIDCSEGELMDSQAFLPRILTPFNYVDWRTDM